MVHVMLLAVLSAEPVPAVESAAPRPAVMPRLWRSEVALGLGVVGSAYGGPTARVGEPVLGPLLTARGVLDVGLTFEVAALLTASPSPAGPYTGLNALARVGWAWPGFAVAAGAVVNVAFGGTPAAGVLPSLRLEARFAPGVGASLGVLDTVGLLPVHVSAELGPFEGVRFTLGYAGLLGAVVGAEVRLPAGFGLRGQAFYYRLFGAEVALATLSVRWGADS